MCVVVYCLNSVFFVCFFVCVVILTIYVFLYINYRNVSTMCFH